MEQNEEKQKNDNKKKVGGIVGVISFIVVFVLMFVFMNIGDDSKKSENEQAAQTYYYEIGDTITYDGLEITLTSYKYSTYFAGAYIVSETDNSFCIVNVKIKNLTSSKKYFQDQILTYTSFEYVYKLIYDENISYLSKWLNSSEFLNYYEEIDPLETITAALCYEVPNEVKNSSKKLEVKFSKNKTNAPEYHIWTLR